MTTKKVTYEDYQEFSGTSELELDQAIDLFAQMHWENEAFLYFHINAESLLQLMFVKEKGLLAEITNDSEEMIFYQKYVSKNECIDLIKRFYNINETNNLLGFYKVPINIATLDKVMNNKQ